MHSTTALLEKNHYIEEFEMLLLMKRRANFCVSIATLVVTLVSVLTGVYLWNTHRESSAAAMNLSITG